MQDIKAFIFDSDGTLVDTTKLIVEGFKQVLLDFGFENHANDKTIHAHIGGHIADVFANIIQSTPQDEVIQKMTSHLDVVQDRIAQDVIKPFPKEKETLYKILDADRQIGLFTSGTIYQVERNMEIVGLNKNEIFSAIVSQEDNLAPKPSPEGLLACAKKLGVPINEVVYIGDHDVDIKAGREAGALMTVGVSHGFHSDDELKNAGADLIIHNLWELTKLLN